MDLKQSVHLWNDLLHDFEVKNLYFLADFFVYTKSEGRNEIVDLYL